MRNLNRTESPINFRFVKFSLVIPLLMVLGSAYYATAPSPIDNKVVSDVIVVHSTTQSCVRDRTRHGVELLQQGYAPRLILLSQRSMEAAREFGVDTSKVILLSEQDHTDTEVDEIKAAMTQIGAHSELIVTEDYQGERTLLISKDKGISKVTISPISNTACNTGLMGLFNRTRDGAARDLYRILRVFGLNYPTGPLTMQPDF